jgi:hypothetical protein
VTKLNHIFRENLVKKVLNIILIKNEKNGIHVDTGGSFIIKIF